MSEEKCKFIKKCVNFKECENLLSGDCHINELSIRCKNDNKCKYFIVYEQLQIAKEENEKLKGNDCEKCENSKNKNIHCWDCLCAKLNIEKQQNKQMREALENVKFEAKFNGNDESLQKIINIVDNTIKGVE